MDAIKFRKDGEPIIARVSAGYAQTGSYELKLWEADRNIVVMRKEGDFINPEDDYYPLPQPNEENDRRRVQAIAVISPLPPIDRYQVALTLSQGGKEIGDVSIERETDDPTVVVNLYALIEGV